MSKETEGDRIRNSSAFRKMLEDYNLKESDFTCASCPARLTCEYSWDPYNLNGDCLASK